MSEQVCGKMVEGFGTMMAYPCVEFTGHRGPCSTHEVPVSVTRRERWLHEHPQQPAQQESEAPEGQGDPEPLSAAQRSTQRLREFQGEAQTTAQRYTENPTPAPGQRVSDKRAPGEPERRWDEDENGRCTWQRAGEQCGFQAGHNGPHGVGEPRFQRTAATAAMCTACDRGDHDECVVFSEESFGNDASDGVQTSCSCYDSNPGAHDGARRDGAIESTRRRDEDQRLPEATNHPVAHEMVRADLLDRLSLGVKRYGQPLQPFNGRDTLQDAYEETLDQAVYLRSMMYAAEASRETLIEEVEKVLNEVVLVSDQMDEVARAVVDHLLGSGAFPR